MHPKLKILRKYTQSEIQLSVSDKAKVRNIQWLYNFFHKVDPRKS